MWKKDETFSNFIEFKALVEKEKCNKVKALRSDNGGEYVSNEFKKICAKEGIRWALKTPHNTQRNGVANKKNISIMGEAWVMLHDQILPMNLWVEAWNTKIYL